MLWILDMITYILKKYIYIKILGLYNALELLDMLGHTNWKEFNTATAGISFYKQYNTNNWV